MEVKTKKRGRWRDIFRRLCANRVALAAMILLLLILLAIVF